MESSQNIRFTHCFKSKNNCKMNERGKHLNKDRSTKTVYRSFFTSGSHPSGIYYKSKNKEDTEKLMK